MSIPMGSDGYYKTGQKLLFINPYLRTIKNHLSFPHESATNIGRLIGQSRYPQLTSAASSIRAKPPEPQMHFAAAAAAVKEEMRS
jgi:hypothetical protein